jgi:Family of unknown function (DUF5330)
MIQIPLAAFRKSEPASIKLRFMKLIRNTTVLMGLLVFLPNPPVDKTADPEAVPSNWAFMAAATDAFQDVKNFCQRQPNACATADYVVARVEAKAKYGMKLAYEWANVAAPDAPIVPLAKIAKKANTRQADEITTGTTAKDATLRGTIE